MSPSGDAEGTGHRRKAAGLGRSEEAYERFAAAVDVPLMVLSVVWLPVLIVPMWCTFQPESRLLATQSITSSGLASQSSTS